MWQRKCWPAERWKDGSCNHDVYHAGVSEGARPTAQGKDPEAAESLHLLEGYDLNAPKHPANFEKKIEECPECA